MSDTRGTAGKFAAAARKRAGRLACRLGRTPLLLRPVEKLPVNSFRLPFIGAVHPDAVFAHLLRNGLEAAIGCPDTLPEGRRVAVTYEELLDRPVETIRRIEEFAGLAPSRAVHDFAEASLQRRSPKIEVTQLSDIEERLAGELMRRLVYLPA